MFVISILYKKKKENNIPAKINNKTNRFVCFQSVHKFIQISSIKNKDNNYQKGWGMQFKNLTASVFASRVRVEDPDPEFLPDQTL